MTSKIILSELSYMGRQGYPQTTWVIEGKLQGKAWELLVRDAPEVSNPSYCSSLPTMARLHAKTLLLKCVDNRT